MTAAQLTSVAVSASGGLSIALGAVAGPFTYTPDTTPIYSLGEDDFIVQESSVGINTGASPGGAALRAGATPVTGGFTDDPVHIMRSTPADANNYIQLQCKDRGNSYNSHVVETFDQAAVDLYGIRRDTSLKADMVVDPYLTGAIVAQLVLQRSLLFRNTYTFKLGWKYCLLEPMDLVQITDTRLGVSALTVRITAVEEDDEGTLTITAEDFFGGYSTAVLYGKQSTAGYIPNWSTGPGDVNMPLIFEPPAALLSGDLEIWVALSGGPNWGGAQVWISSDGSSYAYAGTIPGPATQGVLTATLPSYGGSEPDTTNTLSVDLTESRGELLSVSAGDAANLATLCYAGGELLAYQTATLTTTSHYGLTTLYRGAYGSPIGSHSSGAQFARLDQAIGRFPYPSTLDRPDDLSKISIGQYRRRRCAKPRFCAGLYLHGDRFRQSVRRNHRQWFLRRPNDGQPRCSALCLRRHCDVPRRVDRQPRNGGCRRYRDHDLQHQEKRHKCRNHGLCRRRDDCDF